MSRPKNESIGEVECPHKGCVARCQVYRFRGRGGAVRFAGKLYADCPVHGRYGADGKIASQDYILEHATIWREGKRPENTGPAPVKSEIPRDAPRPVVAIPAGPVKRPVPVPAATVPKWWQALNEVFKV